MLAGAALARFTLELVYQLGFTQGCRAPNTSGISSEGRVQLQQEVLFALARRTEDLIDYRKLQIVLQSADLDLKTKTNCSRAQEALQ